MSAPQNPRPSSSSSHIPPPPPRPQGQRKGCLRFLLIGCGALIVLAIVAVIAMNVWWRRNADEIEAQAGTAAREGARFGIASDEAACFQDAVRRANGSTTVAGTFSVGAYVRACLEYSRESPGFCDNVPPPTALRRSLAWQQERCGNDTGCRTVSQVVQQYCADGRSKRQPADTLKMTSSAGWEQDLPRPAGTAEAQADSGAF